MKKVTTKLRKRSIKRADFNPFEMKISYADICAIKRGFAKMQKRAQASK